MNDFKPEHVQEIQTLMQAFERLDHKCIELRELAGLTERLNEKLNRAEGGPKCNDEKLQKQGSPEMNIVELFNFIADKMETQINVIGNNTERSMQMIG
jgi:phage gpG-like protein